MSRIIADLVTSPRLYAMPDVELARLALRDRAAQREQERRRTVAKWANRRSFYQRPRYVTVATARSPWQRLRRLLGFWKGGAR